MSIQRHDLIIILDRLDQLAGNATTGRIRLLRSTCENADALAGSEDIGRDEAEAIHDKLFEVQEWLLTNAGTCGVFDKAQNFIDDLEGLM